MKRFSFLFLLTSSILSAEKGDDELVLTKVEKELRILQVAAASSESEEVTQALGRARQLNDKLIQSLELETKRLKLLEERLEKLEAIKSHLDLVRPFLCKGCVGKVFEF